MSYPRKKEGGWDIPAGNAGSFWLREGGHGSPHQVGSQGQCSCSRYDTDKRGDSKFVKDVDIEAGGEPTAYGYSKLRPGLKGRNKAAIGN